jgi:hypothetical protein
MSRLSQGEQTGPRDRIVFAVVLIVVGIGGFVSQLVDVTPVAGGVVVLLIGVGLLGAFSLTRQYGYLIPGGIMTGLGAGIVVSEYLTLTGEASGGVIVLGLGLGFVSIWAVSSLLNLAQHHWWPLIPGGILSTVGGALLIGGRTVALLDYWYVAVIAVGLILLWRGSIESRSRG